ncbi:hypothetical protein Tco_0977686 [Tanacetum coccineum]|uniref:Uncharacterized protein n=1 Tax=Tanacetum coccineum TaxID=301880 RepID=A0ABQ5EKT7_9ASTR
MNAKVDELKLSGISVVQDFIDVFPEDLSMTTAMTSVDLFASCKTKVSHDLVIFREEHQCCLLRRGAWSSFEVRVGITEEGEVKWRVKQRRVRAMSMTIQSSVKDKEWATFKRDVQGKANVVTGALSGKEREKPRRVRAIVGSTRFCRKVKEGVKGCKVRFLMVLFSKDTSGSWKSVAATKDIE